MVESITLRCTRCCCSMEQFDPQEMFKTGNNTLIEGSKERCDPLAMFTTMPACAFSCCNKMAPLNEESELLKTLELDIRTADTLVIPIAPPPHGRTRAENASSTLHADTKLLSKVTDSASRTKIPPPPTSTLLALRTPLARQYVTFVALSTTSPARKMETPPPKLCVCDDGAAQRVWT